MTIATLQTPPRSGRPRSRLYQVASRIARRMEPRAAAAFLAAVTRLQDRIDEAALLSAVASGNPDLIEAAVASGGSLRSILETRDMERALRQTAAATGSAGADVLKLATGLDARFNAFDPRVVLFARTEAGRLVVGVSEDVREAIRVVVAAGSEIGLTTAQQATAIREIVGMPSNWARAPLNFAEELRAGTLDRSRLLHDPLLPPRQRRAMQRRVEAEIAARIESGTVTEAWIAEQQRRYSRNLINRRARNIARTETINASNHGLRTGWRQAREQGVLPATAKRVVVVTPDERLRELHAAVPGMNPGGVGLEEPFQTPWGPQPGPPWPADPVNCRCGESLVFTGMQGVL